jgi:ribosomal protein S12 methylthiotransferase accessory factor
MSNLFASAASLLLGDNPQDTGDHDGRLLLEALGYATASGSPADRPTPGPDACHRAKLLRVASRFERVFQLGAPDAPGLIGLAAEFDPAIADPLHAGSPTVGVSGVGLSLQDAFQGCIGEGIEYLSQLQTREDLLVKPGAMDPAAELGPLSRKTLAALRAHRLYPDAAVSWHHATRLTDHREILLPADLCVRRPPDQREIKPPFMLGTGSAAGTSWAAAAVHGLLELIERDAASLWWRGGKQGRSIPPQDEAGLMAEALLTRLRQGVSARRSWLLDITTDIGMPSIASVSCMPNGFGFACGLAARPTLKAAVRAAILEMCQIELAHAVVETKRRERGDPALNERDRVHQRRATLINADQCPLLQPAPERAEHLAIETSDPAAVLQLMVERLGRLGIETFGLDLTRTGFAVPVARIIAPGLQLEPSELVTPRLAGIIGKTGGGAPHTGGVALI